MNNDRHKKSILTNLSVIFASISLIVLIPFIIHASSLIIITLFFSISGMIMGGIALICKNNNKIFSLFGIAFNYCAIILSVMLIHLNEIHKKEMEPRLYCLRHLNNISVAIKAYTLDYKG